jgi:hypothetical protein
VLAAALLLETASPAAAPPDQGPAKARQILERLSVDEATIGQVCRIIACLRAGADAELPELRIVRDASLLARLLAERPDGSAGDPRQMITKLHTPAAREAAQRAFSATERPTGN